MERPGRHAGADKGGRSRGLRPVPRRTRAGDRSELDRTRVEQPVGTKWAQLGTKWAQTWGYGRGRGGTRWYSAERSRWPRKRRNPWSAGLCRLLARGFVSGTPNGIRTRAATLRGWCPRPLDDGGEIFSCAGEKPSRVSSGGRTRTPNDWTRTSCVTDYTTPERVDGQTSRTPARHGKPVWPQCLASVPGRNLGS